MDSKGYQELIQENNQLKELLMNYQNTNRKQDLELKLMIGNATKWNHH